VKRKILGVLLGAILATLGGHLSPASAADQIVKNGVFFPPNVPDCSVCFVEVFPATSPGIQDWRVTEGSVDVYSASAAHYPYQAVDLNGRLRGGIAQTIATTPGTTVRITWQHTRNTADVCKGVGTEGYNVTVEGTDVDQDFTARGTAGSWSPHSVSFNASKSRYQLVFSSNIDGVCGALISDVNGEATAS
jgi:hypothetical protein